MYIISYIYVCLTHIGVCVCIYVAPLSTPPEEASTSRHHISLLELAADARALPAVLHVAAAPRLRGVHREDHALVHGGQLDDGGPHEPVVAVDHVEAACKYVDLRDGRERSMWEIDVDIDRYDISTIWVYHLHILHSNVDCKDMYIYQKDI